MRSVLDARLTGRDAGEGRTLVFGLQSLDVLEEELASDVVGKVLDRVAAVDVLRSGELQGFLLALLHEGLELAALEAAVRAGAAADACGGGPVEGMPWGGRVLVAATTAAAGRHC